MNERKQTAVSHLVGLVFVLAFGHLASAQARPDQRVTLSANYGLVSLFLAPNFNTFYEYENTYGLDTIVSYRFVEMETMYKVKPISVRGEIPLNDRSTLGLQAMYNGYNAAGTIVDSLWNPAINSYDVERSATRYNMHRIRIQAVYTRYFRIENPRWNMFFSTALGANFRIRDYRVGDQRGDFTDSGIFDFPVFPISMRLAYGLRYLIHEQVGLQAEFGLGGPLISVGLNFDF